MKKQLLIGFLTLSLSLCANMTAFADDFEGGPGYSGIQEGYRNGNSSASSQTAAADSGDQTSQDETASYDAAATNYSRNFYDDIAAATVPQPPAETSLVDYTLPFTVVLTTSDSKIWASLDADGAQLSTAWPGEMFRFAEESGDYYKILYDGHDAYISKSTSKLQNTIKMAPGMDKRAQVVMNAFQNLGGKYLYGGSDAANGFDCSGFVMTTLKASGISVARSTKQQITQGTAIDVSQIRPGDLIFYGADEASVNHVALYIGNGLLIHAHSTGLGIRAQSYNFSGQVPLRIVNIIGDAN